MPKRSLFSQGFTLIELLVTIGVIAVLSTVAILAINPPQLLAQSRDSNRLGDLTTLSNAISLFHQETSSSLGTPGVIYLSVPDPTATSSAGTNCSGLGLSGSYHCPSASAYRNTNGTGWLPLAFQIIKPFPPFGELPVDPTNVTSSGECYSYETDGTNWEIAASPESQKYSSQASTNFISGTSLSLLSGSPCGGITYASVTTSLTVSITNVARNMAFDPNTNNMWLAYGNGIDVVQDTSPYAISASVTIDSSTSTSINGLTYDSNNHTMWVAYSDNSGFYLAKVNETSPYATTTVMSSSKSIYTPAFDSNTKTIWTTYGSSTNDLAIVMDSSPYTVAYTQSGLTNGYGGRADNIVFDPHNNTIWAVSAYSGASYPALAKINDTYPYSTTTLEIGGGDSGDTAIVFDSHTNATWNSIGSATINAPFDVTDDTTNNIVTTPGLAGLPAQLIFDSHSNSIWDMSNFAGNLTRIDDTTHATSTFLNGKWPDDGAFDSHTNSIWVAAGSTSTLVTILTPNR